MANAIKNFHILFLTAVWELEMMLSGVMEIILIEEITIDKM